MTVLSCGALAAESVIAGLFFLRFWRESGDRLFLFFGLGFWLLAAQWVGLGLVAPDLDSRHGLYVVRLAAFVVLGAGIVDKNARRGLAPVASGRSRSAPS